MPGETIEAFKDHGILEPNTITRDVDKSRQIFDDLEKVGISMKKITDQLVEEGIDKFIKPYDTLLDNIKVKSEQVVH